MKTVWVVFVRYKEDVTSTGNIYDSYAAASLEVKFLKDHFMRYGSAKDDAWTQETELLSEDAAKLKWETKAS